MLNISKELDKGTEMDTVHYVAFALIRHGLKTLYNFNCDHSKHVGFQGEDGRRPYCKSCYALLEIRTEKVLFKGRVVTDTQFLEKETFIDRELKNLAVLYGGDLKKKQIDAKRKELERLEQDQEHREEVKRRFV